MLDVDGVDAAAAAAVDAVGGVGAGAGTDGVDSSVVGMWGVVVGDTISMTKKTTMIAPHGGH